MRAMRGIFVLVLAIVLPVHVWAASFEAGAEAYERGDYATALKEWRSLAEQGYAKAQYHLGLMYAAGQGVTQDEAEAIQWYWKAADQGDAKGVPARDPRRARDAARLDAEPREELPRGRLALGSGGLDDPARSRTRTDGPTHRGGARPRATCRRVHGALDARKRVTPISCESASVRPRSAG